MKRKLLHYSLLTLFLLVVGSGNVWADEVTFTPGTDTGENSVTKNGITATMTTMNNASYYQIYANQSGTFSITSGTITKIEFTCTASGTSKYGPGNASADVGSYSYSGTKGTWTGSATSVTISSTAQIRMSSLTITYGAADTRTAVSVSSLTISPTTLVVGSGETATATATHDTPACTTGTFTYESLNPEIATCTTAGVITPVAKGKATIKATLNIPNDDANYTVKTGTITEDITISNPSHKATFYVNGIINSETDIEEDDAIAFPSDPTSIGGKEFVGWIKEEIAGNTDTTPAEFFSAGIMRDEDINFYAVFASAIGSGTECWKETAITSLTTSDVFVIAGTMSEGTFAIPNNNGTGSAPDVKSVTVSDGKITTSVTDEIKWNISGDASDGYTFYPNESSTTWLYCNTTAASGSNNNIRVGTGERKLWTLNASNYLITNDKYNDRYMSIYNKTDFRGYINTDNVVPIKFYKLTIEKDYNAYCTSITEPVTISASKYNTYASTNAMDFSSTDVKAYTAKVSGDDVVLTEIAGGIVPANTGVIVYSETAGTFNIPVTTTDATVSDNELVGVTAKTAVPWEADGKYNYILQKDGEGVVKFFKATGASLKANRAYLSTTYDVSKAAARGLNIVFADDMTTGIREKVTVNSEKFATAPVYNLNGQRVSQPTRGLYIVNGKKVVVK